MAHSVSVAGKRRSIRALAPLNLFLADVRDGVGPYLAIYLLSVRHWQPGSIGLAMALPGLVAVLLQTPAGSLVDTSTHKRRLLVLASVVVAVSCVAAVTFVSPPVIYATQMLTGAATTIYAPVVAAITLGLVGHRRFAQQTGHNEAWNHGGNVLAAVLAGLIGYYWRYDGIFYLVALMCALGSWSALRINPKDIDNDLARGQGGDDPKTDEIEATKSAPVAKGAADAPTASGNNGSAAAQSPAETESAPEEAGSQTAGFRQVLGNPRIRRFAIAVILFHFANAAMLPLVGQKLALSNQKASALFMSACIIVAQLVMIPVAAWVSRRAPDAGRKPVFLLAFAVLPVRGVLYTLSSNAYFLVGVQVLDGLAGGIFGVISVIMIADLTRGTGRFNFVQGAIATALGIGASLSTVGAGYLVQHFGYRVGFLALAAVAAVALAFFWFFVEESNPALATSEGSNASVVAPQPALS
ncbi:MFS transporter [Hymenobacter convexus]|uniref:MFS transporter n=1 Tax=Hymenobacter sp. CA1UV-4 TaxID=3063782 RepID=UPI002713ADCB|nr:MFS transporter [Hymenobacter sp. CA1UV-4]MDO7850537.1 MFS transporter [Hymenobacter sp. CA1UV-4]